VTFAAFCNGIDDVLDRVYGILFNLHDIAAPKGSSPFLDATGRLAVNNVDKLWFISCAAVFKDKTHGGMGAKNVNMYLNMVNKGIHTKVYVVRHLREPWSN
jgi:hypothetical protein